MRCIIEYYVVPSLHKCPTYLHYHGKFSSRYVPRNPTPSLDIVHHRHINRMVEECRHLVQRLCAIPHVRNKCLMDLPIVLQ